MTVYVALLRGVNVGGRGKLDMKDLKRAFEKLGCEDVRTYINSGNVLFRDTRTAAALTRAVEDALGIRVAVRSLAQMRRLVRSIPDAWTNDTGQKTDVAFFLDKAGAKAFNARRADLKRGEGVVDVGDALITARNVNTVRKLTAMMEEM